MNLESVDIEPLNAMPAEQLLAWAAENFAGRAAIGTSLQKTGLVMIDMACRLGLDLGVFFIDTLLDFPETYELLGRVQDRYSLTIEVLQPDPQEVELLRQWLGQYEHYRNREACCRVRKTQPLQRKLPALDVWIAGLRADQSTHRRDNAARASWERDTNGRSLVKLNPLLDWSLERLDAYIRQHDVPTNPLYDYVSPYGERYTVLSCQRCHIPVMPHEDPRSGKWPWESAGKKECGLHENGSGI